MIDKKTGLLYSVNRDWGRADRTRRFKFVEHRINPGFPEGHFTYSPDEGVVVERVQFVGDRAVVKDRAARFALNLLRLHLLGQSDWDK